MRVLPGYEGLLRSMQLVFPSGRALALKLRAFLDWAATPFPSG